jgi:hypothetical protein
MGTQLYDMRSKKFRRPRKEHAKAYTRNQKYNIQVYGDTLNDLLLFEKRNQKESWDYILRRVIEAAQPILRPNMKLQMEQAAPYKELTPTPTPKADALRMVDALNKVREQLREQLVKESQSDR